MGLGPFITLAVALVTIALGGIYAVVNVIGRRIDDVVDRLGRVEQRVASIGDDVAVIRADMSMLRTSTAREPPGIRPRPSDAGPSPPMARSWTRSRCRSRMSPTGAC